ncbi:MAG TPA: ATP-binding cassette domain-containing protein [Bryobacteraceae bacterium]|nr:ATP-binding cassette domain-containing protein [Bryobacteraceae bacterium]
MGATTDIGPAQADAGADPAARQPQRTQEREQAPVRFDHVFKSFQNKKVLQDVSFQIAPGEAFCLLGRSGMGKSVTLKLMIGLLKPDRGGIFIHGTNLADADNVTLNKIRTSVGFLFQGAGLFDSLTVGENVAFPLRRHTRKSNQEIRSIVQQKLKAVELEKELNTMPSDLSGGMRKRVGLARALSLDPNILLVDEPSSGLDRITATEIYRLLLRLKKNRNVTLVAVTHDAMGARTFGDRFAVLDRGSIVACGSFEEVEKSENSLVRELAAGSET